MASKKKGRRPRKKNPPKDVAVTDDLGHPLVMNDPDPNGTPHWKYRARASGVWSAADYPTAEKAKMARIRSMRKKPGRRKNPIGVGLKPGKGSKMKAPRKRTPPAVKDPVDLSVPLAELLAEVDATVAALRTKKVAYPLRAHMFALEGTRDQLVGLMTGGLPKGKSPKVVRTNPGAGWKTKAFEAANVGTTAKPRYLPPPAEYRLETQAADKHGITAVLYSLSQILEERMRAATDQALKERYFSTAVEVRRAARYAAVALKGHGG